MVYGQHRNRKTMRASIRRESARSWSVRFDLPPGMNGRRRQKRMTVQGTRRDAEAAAARYLADLSRGEFSQSGRISMHQLFARWLTTLTVQCTTMRRYRGIVRDFLDPVLGKIYVAKLTPAHIEIAIKAWSQQSRRDRKRGPSLLERSITPTPRSAKSCGMLLRRICFRAIPAIA